MHIIYNKVKQKNVSVKKKNTLKILYQCNLTVENLKFYDLQTKITH